MDNFKKCIICEEELREDNFGIKLAKRGQSPLRANICLGCENTDFDLCKHQYDVSQFDTLEEYLAYKQESQNN